jgi:predicted ATPase
MQIMNQTSPPLRIVLTGAHGTGKTTLVRALSSYLKTRGKHVAITPESPRLLCEQSGSPDFFRRANNNVSKQLLILIHHLHQEQLALRHQTPKEYAIFDRGLLDHWAYTVVLHRDVLQAHGVYELLLKTVIEHISHYELLIYVPIEFPPLDDGTRESDGAFQRQIDREIQSVLSMNSLRFTEVSGSVDERVLQIIKCLNI